MKKLCIALAVAAALIALSAVSYKGGAIDRAVAMFATPTPTPTPTPSPTPTPTPTPFVQTYYGEAEREHLFFDMEQIRLVSPKGRKAELHEEPDASSGTKKFKSPLAEKRNDFIVLDTVAGTDGKSYYYVEAAYSGDRGYLSVDAAAPSENTENGVTGTFAMMQRPGCAVFAAADTENRLIAQEDYHAVRLLGTKRRPHKEKYYYYVVTQEGNYGYMEPEVLRPAGREEIAAYLDGGSLVECAERFDRAAFADAAEEKEGAEAASMTEFLYDELTQAGIFFQPGYYRYFTKDLRNDALYPDGLYRDDVYNSRLFLLRNSAGNFALTAGEETEWAYIDDYAATERGDLLFFAEYGPKDTAVVPGAEAVLKGKYSGYVTDCALALGDDRVLAVRGGRLTVIERFSSDPLCAYFDSARRISPEVTDVKAHFFEKLIAAVYDRLGTPYDNFDRVGDSSYDCSGIICWAMRSMGVHRTRTNDGSYMKETTASGWSTTRNIWFPDGTNFTMDYLNPYTKVYEDLDRLERGDLVFLYGKNHKVGHVMIYLGNNTVIHSTTIDDTYRGTLVAQIRPELQQLYYGTNRVSGVFPPKRKK